MTCGQVVRGKSGDATSSPNPPQSGGCDRPLPAFLDHSPPLLNLLGARRLTSMDFLASGFQLGLLDREYQQQISKIEEMQAEVFVPLAFPVWCHKQVAVS